MVRQKRKKEKKTPSKNLRTKRTNAKIHKSNEQQREQTERERLKKSPYLTAQDSLDNTSRIFLLFLFQHDLCSKKQQPAAPWRGGWVRLVQEL
jgi:hypothetical protein